MGSIPAGTQAFYLSHARVMLISSLFTFHYIFIHHLYSFFEIVCAVVCAYPFNTVHKS